MKRLLTLLLILFSWNAQGQIIDAIGDVAAESFSIASDIGGSDACVDGCFDGCFIIFDPSFWYVLHEVNRDFIMRKKDEGYDRLRSLELSANLGLLSRDLTVFLPQVRYNSGRWGSNFRVLHAREKRLEGTDIYSTYDWQIINYNMIVQRDWRFYLGAGLSWENIREQSSFGSSQSQLHLEYTAGFDLHLDDRVRLRGEGRYGWDPENSRTMRTEVNGTLSYLLNNSYPRVYANATALTSKYYSTVNLWTAGGGLSIEF